MTVQLRIVLDIMMTYDTGYMIYDIQTQIGYPRLKCIRSLHLLEPSGLQAVGMLH
jgi:hypothetical protein